MTSNEVMLGDQVKTYTDFELREKLTRLGMDVGPITGTTRSLYERKLIQLLSGNQSHRSDETNGSSFQSSPSKSSPSTPKAANRTSLGSNPSFESPTGDWRADTPYPARQFSDQSTSTINLIRARNPIRQHAKEEFVSSRSYPQQNSPFPAANAQFRKRDSDGSMKDHILKFVLFCIVMLVVVYFIVNQDPEKALEHRS